MFFLLKNRVYLASKTKSIRLMLHLANSCKAKRSGVKSSEKFLVIVFLLFHLSSIVALRGLHTTLIPRSESVNAARELVGWYSSINLCNKDENYWSLSFNPTYNRSYNNDQIESFLLGKKQFKISGARVVGRGSDDILADYFGLPSDYQGSICFAPRISTFMFDFDWFWGLDRWLQGLYFRAHAPMVHTIWDLNAREKVSVAGTLDFPAGYMGPERIVNANLPHSVKEVMDNNIKAVTFGDMQDSIAYGKILERQARSCFSDIQGALGYNAYCTNWSHFGFNLRGSIPAGNKPNPMILFDPVIGNGHHWELGAGLSWHATPWVSEDELDYFGMYSDLNITHLFKDTQCRSFDLFNAQDCSRNLCDKNLGNRYTLVERFFAPESTDVHVNDSPISVQYQGNLLPTINVTTLPTQVSFPVQVDFALMFVYHRFCDLDINWGYNLWFRAAEKLHCRDRLCENSYALKGDAQIFGFDSNNPLKLSATQSMATIFSGQKGGNFAGTLYANDNVDNPVRADNTSDVALTQLNTTDSVDFGIAQADINTSSPVKLLTDCDINEDSALMPRALTHKVFVNIGRVWRDHTRAPFVGIGAELEWRCQCVTNNSAISQWGIWIKGGFTS